MLKKQEGSILKSNKLLQEELSSFRVDLQKYAQKEKSLENIIHDLQQQLKNKDELIEELEARVD